MLTQEQLKELLHYDTETGDFAWVDERRQSRRKPGGDNGKGYIKIMVHGKRHYAHRLAWFYCHGEWPHVVDHINGNSLDNRLCNLRPTDKGGNNKNSRIRRESASGIKGVWKSSPNKWAAEIKSNGNRYYLGSFSSLEEAKKAIQQKRLELHGEYANHG